MVKLAKHSHCSALVASASRYSMVPFRVTHSLLGDGLPHHMQGHCEECSHYLADKIIWICSEIDSVIPKELKTGFQFISSATCCGPSRMIKATHEVTCGWFHAVGVNLFEGGMVQSALKEAVVHHLLKKTSLDLTLLDNYWSFVQDWHFIGKMLEGWQSGFSSRGP